MITDLKEEDIEQLLLMSDKFIGKNYQTYDTIKNYIPDPQKIIKVYWVNNDIAGFAKGKIIEINKFRESLLKINASIEEVLNGKGYAGVAETICLKEEYRGTRIAKELAEELNHSLRKLKDIDMICTTLWKTREGASAKKTFERMGFKYVTEIPAYWHDDSIEKDYTCPNCGRPPCNCSMLFYMIHKPFPEK